MSNRYPMFTLKEMNEDNTEKGKIKRTRVFVTKRPNQPILQNTPEIARHAGVRRVVEAILASRKPLIGFQAMGDIMYMIGGIYRELPARLTDFLRLMENVDLLVDLKEIVGIESLKGENLRNCSLVHAVKEVGTRRE